jgi:hypothetical protein
VGEDAQLEDLRELFPWTGRALIPLRGSLQTVKDEGSEQGHMRANVRVGVRVRVRMGVRVRVRMGVRVRVRMGVRVRVRMGVRGRVRMRVSVRFRE